MKQVITGLIVYVEVTGYNDEGQVTGRSAPPNGEKPIQFQVLEADIPPDVAAWVKGKIGLKED